MSLINEAGWDRIGRVALGVILLSLGWTGVVDGGLGSFFQWFGFVPLATGLAGWCPIYAILGFRTRQDEPRAASPA